LPPRSSGVYGFFRSDPYVQVALPAALLGVWLIINGFAYLIISFSGLLLPQYEDMVSNHAFHALLGEMAFMPWLVIKGAKPQAVDVVASSSAAGATEQ
jgi:hypothetical protein